MGRALSFFFGRILFPSPQEMVFLIKVTVIGHFDCSSYNALHCELLLSGRLLSVQKKKDRPCLWIDTASAGTWNLPWKKIFCSGKNLEVDILCWSRHSMWQPHMPYTSYRRQCQIKVRFESRGRLFFKALEKRFWMAKYAPIIIIWCIERGFYKRITWSPVFGVFTNALITWQRKCLY